MKPIFTLFCFSFSLVVFGQNYSVSTLADRDSLKIIALYENPTDSTQILAVEEGAYSNNGAELNLFTVDQLGNYAPLNHPTFQKLRSMPVEFEGKYFFAAETQSSGTELISFDGTTANIIDLEIGAIGSKPYNLKVENGLLYFTAIISNEHQLFSYSTGSGVQQITNESGSVNLNFISKIDTNLFYSKYDANGLCELKRLTDLGGLSIVRSKNFSISGLYANWASIYKVGTQFLISEDESNSSLTNIRVIGTSDFLTIDTLVEENLSGLGFAGNLEVINGQLFAKLQHHYYAYDGSNFNQFYPSLPHDLRDLFYFENTYYGIARDIFGEPEMIYKFEGGVATELYSNRHLHLILVDNHDAYFSDWNPDPTMPSGIVRLSYDQIDTIPVSLDGFHSPYDHAAMMWDQKLTFLYSNSQPIDNTDIMQLDGLLKVNIVDKSGFALFPNPVKAESQLMLTSPKESLIECFDAIGNKVKTQKVFLGYNSIDLNGLLPGTYFLKIDEHTFKQIIE
jgi:ELWxxDGT repeat protein